MYTLFTKVNNKIQCVTLTFGLSDIDILSFCLNKYLPSLTSLAQAFSLYLLTLLWKITDIILVITFLMIQAQTIPVCIFKSLGLTHSKANNMYVTFDIQSNRHCPVTKSIPSLVVLAQVGLCLGLQDWYPCHTMIYSATQVRHQIFYSILKAAEINIANCT